MFKLDKNISKAILTLLNSREFCEEAKADAKLRVFRQRFNEGRIGNSAALNILEQFGYEVTMKVKG